MLQEFKSKILRSDQCFNIRPSVFKFNQFFMCQDKKTLCLCNLALFIREAFKLRTNINIIVR